MSKSLDERVAALLASDPAEMADANAIWEEIRRASPAYDHHGSLVLLTGYDEVKSTIRDGVRFSERALFEGSRAQEIMAGLTPEQLEAHLEISAFEEMYISRSDDETHERLRTIAHRAFTPRRIEGLQAAVERYTDELLAPLQKQGEADLLQFAYGLPMQVVGDLLGIPAEDREQVHAWSGALAANRGGTNRAALLPARAALREFRAYVDAIAEQHRRTGSAGELVDALLDANESDRLSPAELAAMWVVLLFAGHETTTNLLAIGTYELLRRPDQWRLLCEDPDARVENAVDELLRFVTPVQFLNRIVREDLELAGMPVPAGRTVFPVLAAANRDPAVFERPADLDILRPEAKNHLAFGYGPHFCLGYSLARLEATTAFAALASRFPKLELATDGVEFTGHSMLRTIRGLPVRFERG